MLGWIIHNKINYMHLETRSGEFSFNADFNQIIKSSLHFLAKSYFL